jgi:hypothetical protein
MLYIDALTFVAFPSGGCVIILIFSLGLLTLLAEVNVTPLSVPASYTPPLIVFVATNMPLESVKTMFAQPINQSGLGAQAWLLTIRQETHR